MARARTRLPNVFVGHPFGARFPVDRFRDIFRQLPFNVIWGDEGLHTKDLLHVLKTHIKRVDYAIFDLTNWNPNVSLELGLAEGLRKRQKDYYILLNARRFSDVPADVRGLQRLEYKSYDFKPKAGLGYKLVTQLLVKEHWVKKIWKSIPDDSDGQKKRMFALRILGRLRNGRPIRSEEIRPLARGTGLSESDCREVLTTLRKRRIVGMKRSRRGSKFVVRQGVFGRIPDTV